MSLANEASLLLIPSGYKSGIVYSVFPTDGDGDFTFSRGSDGTRVGAGGLIETMSSNIPRLDYLNSNCPSLLLEPQRTNLVQYSEDFTQWLDTGVTVTPNQVSAPDGTLTADKLESTTNNWRRATFINTISGSLNTVSLYVKRDNSTNTVSSRIEVGNGGGSVSSSFNTLTGSITGNLVNPFIIDKGNGWYRIGGTYTSNQASNIVYIYPSSGYGTSGTMFFWGAQVEQGSYVSSYIKTTGSTVTRLKDICINGGDADLFNITEGTFFVDAYAPNSTNSTIISLSNGTDAQKITLLFEAVNSRVRTYSSGGVLYYNNLSYNQRNKILITFKLNEYKTYINGSLVSTDTSATVPTGMFKLNFSHNNGTILHFEGKVHDTRVYNRVLTQAEAIQLTTL
jgi:hypothetical protein